MSRESRSLFFLCHDEYPIQLGLLSANILQSLVRDKTVRQVWDNQTIIACDPNTNPKVKHTCGPENEARFGDESNRPGVALLWQMCSPCIVPIALHFKMAAKNSMHVLADPMH